MTEIHTLSAADFKHTMQKNDLYDSNIDMRTDLAIISIGNSFEDDLADDIFANGPSSHWFKRSHKNVLNLDFDDIAAPEEWGSLSKCNQYILFDDDMAWQIASACFLIMPEKKYWILWKKCIKNRKSNGTVCLKKPSESYRSRRPASRQYYRTDLQSVISVPARFWNRWKATE